MKIFIIAAAFAIPSPAFAQQEPMPTMDHSKMPSAEKSPMPPMDHSKMDHSKMDHSHMDDSKMDHSKMDHSKMDHSKMDHSKMSMEHADMMAMMNDPNNPYGATEMDMHKKMMMAKDGLPSELWTRKMIEHHRGAIAMSRVALEKATDKQTRKMAQMTITAQTREIANMQAWLKSHGKTAQ